MERAPQGRIGGALKALCVLAVLGLIAWPSRLHAHGILEVRYSPPIPGWLFLLGGGLAVALSFVLVVLRQRAGRTDYRRWHIKRGAWSRALIAIGAAIGLGLTALIVVNALLVDSRSETALAPLLVWSGWWMGLTWIVLLFGNLWPLLDPWNTLRRLFARILPHAWSLGYPLPGKLALMPAIVALLLFAWFEMGWFRAQDAGGVLGLLVAFSLWIWLGMLIFRPSDWWAQANPFARYFKIFGRFGCIGAERSTLELRLPGAALYTAQAETMAEAVFVVLMLLLVSFDGFIATPEWWILLRHMMTASYAIAPKSLAYHGAFLAALIAGAALFVGCYVGVCRLMARRARNALATREVAKRFALTLLPIAAAYHVAHFLPAVPARVSKLLRAASDPLGQGWDIFATSHFEWAVTWTPTAIGYLWLTQTGLIVLGHAYAIALAHAKAVDLFRERRTAVLAELPLTLLMIGYTMVSLWIISRPVLNEPLVPIPGLTP